jgi:hypothetical protein
VDWGLRRDAFAGRTIAESRYLVMRRRAGFEACKPAIRFHYFGFPEDTFAGVDPSLPTK